MISIAAVDPGVTTGVAACDYEETSSQLVIARKIAFSSADEATLEQIINTIKPFAIAIEAMPQQPSSIGQKTWFEVHGKLTQMGFYPNPKKDSGIEHNVIYQITPGLWKPVMRKADIPYTQWLCTNQHERDATAMLLYWIRTIAKGKEVKYGHA